METTLQRISVKQLEDGLWYVKLLTSWTFLTYRGNRPAQVDGIGYADNLSDALQIALHDLKCHVDSKRYK